MKRFFILLVAIIVASTVSWAGASVVSAQSAITDQQRDAIRTNCTAIKNTLNQLKVSDALLRVNRGQLYESMRSRLMEPFNNRLSSNNLDARSVEAVTGSYSTQLSNFRTHYQDYERQLSDAIRIDCENDPDGFYLAVENARTKRTTVNEDVLRLHQLIDDYRASVSDFILNFDQDEEES